MKTLAHYWRLSHDPDIAQDIMRDTLRHYPTGHGNRSRRRLGQLALAQRDAMLKAKQDHPYYPS